VKNSESLLETFKELVVAANPGLVTQDDLRRVEQRVAELEELVEELAERLSAAREPGGTRPPRPR